MDLLEGINLFAVIVAAIAAFAIGAFWYTALFGKAWQKEVGLSNSELASGNIMYYYLGSFILMLLMAFGLAWVLQLYENIDFVLGVTRGFLVGLFFVATSIGINMLYQRKAIRLFLIDAGYQVLFMVVIGAILGIIR